MLTLRIGDLLSSILLCAVMCLVLVGNALVVAAVATSRKLRTVTNVFIVNLACADLLLGVLVLPFSAVLEIKETWIFGNVWCQVWLAVDVWLCTASILNLCCISLDRYLAITRPIRYPGLMSSRRAKTLVAGVWLFSFIIGCPPLIGWNDSSEVTLESNETTTPALLFTSTSSQPNCHQHSSLVNLTCSDLVYTTTCELTNSRGYRIYAALGSFFIPMLVMVFFYLQIYRAAVRTILAYEKGELKTKYSVKETSNGLKTNSVTLRIHRGGRGFSSAANSTCSAGQTAHSSPRDVVVVAAAAGDRERQIKSLGRGEGFVGQTSIRKARSSDASLVTLTDLASEAVDNGNSHESPSFETEQRRCKSPSWKKDQNSHEDSDIANFPENHENAQDTRAKLCGTQCVSMDSDESSSGDGRIRIKRINDHKKSSPQNSYPLTNSVSSSHIPESGLVFVRKTSQTEQKTRRPRFSAQKPANTMKLHMQKFNREKKAAKTLAIIVGAFIVCWMPFFTTYLVGAFCDSCIAPMTFSIVFWLGYCNSAMNPCVYALFSRDFRFAFRKLVTCKCNTWHGSRSSRPLNSDLPAIQLHCAPQDEARSSSDIDGHWR